MTYIVVKQHKSVGIAILLTFLFGPIGLFYATVRGGLTMTFAPFLLIILSVIGVLGGSSILLAGSTILLIIFAFTCWLICLIWAAVAVDNYNKLLIYEANQVQFYSEIVVQPKSVEQTLQGQAIKTSTPDKLISTETGIPEFQEWRKTNPHKSLNEYYGTYNILTAVSPPGDISNLTANTYNKTGNSKTLLWAVAAVIVLVTVVFVFRTDQAAKFTVAGISNIFDNDSKEKKIIKDEIENVYFGLINGAYTAQGLTGTTPGNLPFYNSDLTTMIVMGLAPLSLLSGTITIEPRNIIVNNIKDNKADVSYDLAFRKNEKETITPIKMTVKKIGGNWKLDGQKFLPVKGKF